MSRVLLLDRIASYLVHSLYCWHIEMAIFHFNRNMYFVNYFELILFRLNYTYIDDTLRIQKKIMILFFYTLLFRYTRSILLLTKLPHNRFPISLPRMTIFEGATTMRRQCPRYWLPAIRSFEWWLPLLRKLWNRSIIGTWLMTRRVIAYIIAMDRH